MPDDPDEQTPPTTKTIITYRDYLASPEWREKCWLVLFRAGHECRTCPSRENLEVHHRTYVRVGREYQEDLIALCRECHEAITKSIHKRPTEKQEYVPWKDDMIRDDLRENITSIVESVIHDRYSPPIESDLRNIENEVTTALSLKEPRIIVLQVRAEWPLDIFRYLIYIDYHETNNYTVKHARIVPFQDDLEYNIAAIVVSVLNDNIFAVISIGGRLKIEEDLRRTLPLQIPQITDIEVTINGPDDDGKIEIGIKYRDRTFDYIYEHHITKYLL